MKFLQLVFKKIANKNIVIYQINQTFQIDFILTINQEIYYLQVPFINGKWKLQIPLYKKYGFALGKDGNIKYGNIDYQKW